MSRQKEEQGIGRNMKVEIDQTVYQKGTTAEESGEVQRRGKGLVSLEDLAKSDEKKRAEEPSAANSAGDSSFGEHFEIVVVSMVNDFAIVLGLVGGEDGLKRAEAGAGVFVVEKDAEGVLPHRGAFTGGDFESLEIMASEPWPSRTVYAWEGDLEIQE